MNTRKRRWLKVGGIALGVVAVIACGASLLLCRSQAHMLVYHPPEWRYPSTRTPDEYGMTDYETVSLTTEDGYTLAGWYVPSGNQAAIIVPGGYKSPRDAMLYQSAMLAKHGYGMIILDLRAHGESDGDLISFGLYEVNDVEAAYQYLLTRPDVDPERIGSLGVSMGGVVVLLHAAQNPAIKAVVSESAFASLESEVAVGVKTMTGLPPFPFAPIIQWFAEQEVGFDADEVAAVAHIGEISPRAVLLLQGGADMVVPTDSGHLLYDAAGEPRELWFEPDVGHSAFSFEMAEEYEARVAAFFDRHLLGE